MDHVFRNATDALPQLTDYLLRVGDEVGSRNGRVLESMNTSITLTHPLEREILTPGRRASLVAQVAETAWVLAGRNDIEWLSRYLPRAADFSDDGVTWRGAYGPRIRNWHGQTDQLQHVVDLLREDPLTRRAVIALYDPAVDSAPGKDIPCNNWLHFTSRFGSLDLHVATRSNDLWWGWSGINAFEWSVLLEVVARMVGAEPGRIRFDISSLHLYDRHWKRAEATTETYPGTRVPAPRFELTSIEALDHELEQWFALESEIREDPSLDHRPAITERLTDPMLRSWLRVIAAHWSGDRDRYLPHHDDLTTAFAMSPKPKSAKARPFIEAVKQLHADKDKVYGNSWCRRGEMISILANIARKVDRMGVAGAGDTLTDTYVDLLVYLVKYRLWLVTDGMYQQGRSEVDRYLDQLPSNTIPEVNAADTVRELFDRMSEENFILRSYAVTGRNRLDGVERMIELVAPLAEKSWNHDAWKAKNATRTWKGYDQP